MTDITSTPATSVADDPLAFYVRLDEPTVDADGVRTSRVRSTCLLYTSPSPRDS